MKKSVFALLSNEKQLAEIVALLKSAGFYGADISALLPDKAGGKDLGHERHTKAPEGAAMGGLFGSVILGGVGLLAGLGMVAIPGMGPFIAAGPLLACLSGAGAGALAGGAIGALVGKRFPEYEAKRYRGNLSQGSILLSIHCETEAAVKKANRILEGQRGEEIATCREVDVRLASSDEGVGLPQPSQEIS